MGYGVEFASESSTSAMFGKRLKELRGKVTLEELSDRTGLSVSYLSRLQSGDRQGSIEAFTKIAKALDVPLSAFISGKDTCNEIETFEPQPLAINPMDWPKDLPVLGVVAGGDDAFFELNGQVVEMTRRPPKLGSVKGAYALYVTGDSCAPRYHNGEMVWVHPQRPAQQGQWVVVQMLAPEGEAPKALIGQLRRRTAHKIIVYKPGLDRDVDLPAPEVKSIHVIVMGGEAP